MCCDGSSRQELRFLPDSVEASRFHLWDTDFAGVSHRFIPCPPRGDTWRWLRSSTPAGSAAPPPALRRRPSREGSGQRPDAPPEPDRDCCHKHHGLWMVANVGLSPGDQEALQGGRRSCLQCFLGHISQAPSLCVFYRTRGEGVENQKVVEEKSPSPKGSQLLQKLESFFVVSF